MFLPQISGPKESGVDNRAKSVTSSGGPTELPHIPHIDPALLAAWIVDRAKRNMAKIVLFPGNQHDLEQQPASQPASHAVISRQDRAKTTFPLPFYTVLCLAVARYLCGTSIILGMLYSFGQHLISLTWMRTSSNSIEVNGMTSVLCRVCNITFRSLVFPCCSIHLAELDSVIGP